MTVATKFSLTRLCVCRLSYHWQYPLRVDQYCDGGFVLTSKFLMLYYMGSTLSREPCHMKVRVQQSIKVLIFERFEHLSTKQKQHFVSVSSIFEINATRKSMMQISSLRRMAVQLYNNVKYLEVTTQTESSQNHRNNKYDGQVLPHFLDQDKLISVYGDPIQFTFPLQCSVIHFLRTKSEFERHQTICKIYLSLICLVCIVSNMYI